MQSTTIQEYKIPWRGSRCDDLRCVYRHCPCNYLASQSGSRYVGDPLVPDERRHGAGQGKSYGPKENKRGKNSAIAAVIRTRKVSRFFAPEQLSTSIYADGRVTHNHTYLRGARDDGAES